MNKRKAYPRDLSDEQWERIEPLLPKKKQGCDAQHSRREMMNALPHVDHFQSMADLAASVVKIVVIDVFLDLKQVRQQHQSAEEPPNWVKTILRLNKGCRASAQGAFQVTTK